MHSFRFSRIYQSNCESELCDADLKQRWNPLDDGWRKRDAVSDRGGRSQGDRRLLAQREIEMMNVFIAIHFHLWKNSDFFLSFFCSALTWTFNFIQNVNLHHEIVNILSRNCSWSISISFSVLSVRHVKQAILFCPQWKCIGPRSVNEKAKLCLLLKIVSLQSQMIGYLCFSFISISMSCSSFVSWNWDKMWETKLQHRILCTIVYVQRTCVVYAHRDKYTKA